MEDEDEVVAEYPVYISKTLQDKLLVFQYPNRPEAMKYDDIAFIDAKCRPKQNMVQLELSLNSSVSSYDRSRAEQIALNVDGSQKDESKCYFNSKYMDKVRLSSSCASSSTMSNYAAGVFKNGELHVTPIKSVINLRPNFGYLDLSDAKTAKQEKSDAADGDSQDEAEVEAKPVMVQFARPETDRLKKFREKSYHYLQKRINEEDWIKTDFHFYKSDASIMESKKLICQKCDKNICDNSISAKEYFEKLIPESLDPDFNKPNLPNNVLSMAQLRTMSLGDQLKIILTNARIVRFNQLLTLLPKDLDPLSVIRTIQQVAVLVQGCWLVKSEILYPKDTVSVHTGVASELLCRGRDYIMWKFTQSRFVIRKEVLSIVKLPQEDIKEFLEQMARVKPTKGWEFLLPTDDHFIQRYPEVVQRQQMLWETKQQQLFKVLKIGKCGSIESKAKGSTNEISNNDAGHLKSPTKTKSPRRRRSSQMGEMDGERTVDIKSIKTEVMDVDMVTFNIKPEPKSDDECASVPIKMEDELHQEVEGSLTNGTFMNGGELQTSINHLSNDAMMELIKFVKEKLYSCYCLTNSELRHLLSAKMTESAPGNVLSTGISDQVLEQAVVAVNGEIINRKWTKTFCSEPLYAVLKFNDSLDETRRTLINFFSTNTKARKGTIKKKIETTIGNSIEEEEFQTILKNYCILQKNGVYYLKGTSSLAAS